MFHLLMSPSRKRLFAARPLQILSGDSDRSPDRRRYNVVCVIELYDV